MVIKKSGGVTTCSNFIYVKLSFKGMKPFLTGVKFPTDIFISYKYQQITNCLDKQCLDFKNSESLNE